MAETLIAPLPCCPVHGLLQRRSVTEPLGGGISLITCTEWTCSGWDGEGCGYRVADEDLDWQPASPEQVLALTAGRDAARG